MSCPICTKEAASEYRPFCSKRCADVDLGRWLNGSYAIAGEPAEPSDIPKSEGDDAPQTRH
ncbi:MAG: DNA gyrase inhibitor YacG [Boseongicola sp.]|nr:DNA gyrase inhibitor YacG [Boseongicola sp.]